MKKTVGVEGMGAWLICGPAKFYGGPPDGHTYWISAAPLEVGCELPAPAFPDPPSAPRRCEVRRGSTGSRPRRARAGLPSDLGHLPRGVARFPCARRGRRPVP